jgi:AP-1 complex subunit mu
VAVAIRNINTALIFSFLYKLVEILVDYFKNLEEESIRDNFVLVYELLDEILDFGYPQTTETKVLKEFIKTESNTKNNAIKMEITKTLTNVVNWRAEGIKYKKNEAYLDVIEKVDCLIASNGDVLHSQVLGILKMKASLTGMPNVALGLNDKALFDMKGKKEINPNHSTNRTVDLDDLKFHQCVDMNKFGLERSIDFVPPDGEFELMSYRLDMQLKPLIWAEVKMESISSTKVEYTVKAKTNFKNRITANNVDIFIPVPNDLQKATFKAAVGTVIYLSDREDILWNIKTFEGETELSMKCTFQVPTVRIGKDKKVKYR